MNSSEEFFKTISEYIRARFPIIYVVTHEEARFVSGITELARAGKEISKGKKVFEWSNTLGFAENGELVDGDHESPVHALIWAGLIPESAIFIFKDLHRHIASAPGLTPSSQLIRLIRETASKFKNGDVPKTLVVVAPELEMPLEIQNDVVVLDFPLPGIEEISEMLESLIAGSAKDAGIEISLNDAEKEVLVRAAIGLSTEEAESVFARAIVNDGKLNIDDVRLVMDEKKQIIRKTQILEFIEDGVSAESVGGLQNLKNWLEVREGSWTSDAKPYLLSPPKGALVVGVPGCGKSLTAKSMSSKWNLPLVKLDLGRVFGMYIGESERNLRAALKTVESIAPCVLWIDEIEKGFGGNGDSDNTGTSTRVLGTFLNWMQEKRSSVFVIATANNIAALPPEFTRKGRFDQVFFVDLPTENERKQIWQIHLGKISKSAVSGDLDCSEDQIGRLAQKSDGFSGAEIAHVIQEASFSAFHKREKVFESNLDVAISTTIPISVSQREKLELLREWSLSNAMPASITDSDFSAKEDNESSSATTRTGRKPTRTIDVPKVNDSPDAAIYGKEF